MKIKKSIGLVVLDKGNEILYNLGMKNKMREKMTKAKIISHKETKMELLNLKQLESKIRDLLTAQRAYNLGSPEFKAYGRKIAKLRERQTELKKTPYVKAKEQAIKIVETRISEGIFYRDRTPRGHELRKNYTNQISRQRALLKSIENNQHSREQLERIKS